MIKWVANPNQFDIFPSLFNEKYSNMTAPIATDDGLLINTLIISHMYNGLYQFEMNIDGSSMCAVNDLNELLLTNDIQVLQFPVD